MKNNIFLFCPMYEFSSFLRVNSFICRLKQKYPNIYVTAVVCDMSKDIIVDADEIITISSNHLNEQSANYPQILEIIGGTRNVSNFFTIAFDYITNKLQITKDKIYIWDDYYVHDFDNNIVFKELMDYKHISNPSDLAKTYIRDYETIQNWLSVGNTIKPTEEVYNDIKNKYSNLFDDNTYVLVSRNFKNKQPQTNTDIIVPNFKEIITNIVNSGIRIINIGFPPVNFNLNTKFYHELNIQLTEGEIISLFYLSKGVLLNGYNAGFCPHAAANVDVFKIHPEFIGDYFFMGRKNNPNILSVDMIDDFKDNNIDNIIKVFNLHTKIAKNIFSEKKKITYLKY